jgi:site-specific recombinase XerD
MDLLHHGADPTAIALWLGHESVETTQIYLHSSLELKRKALAKAAPFNGRFPQYRPDDRLLAFLKSL